VHCSALRVWSALQCVVQLVVVCCSALQWNIALQCVAVRCSALQWVAVRCSALQRVAVRCNTLQCVAVKYNMTVRCCALQCIAARCCKIPRCSVLQCVAVCCSVLQCVAVHCNEILSKMTSTYSIVTFDLRVFSVIFNRNVGMVNLFDSWSFVPCAFLKWKCCGVLSDTACCSALQCVAVHCSVLQCVAVWCIEIILIEKGICILRL